MTVNQPPELIFQSIKPYHINNAYVVLTFKVDGQETEFLMTPSNYVELCSAYVIYLPFDGQQDIPDNLS
jgi:hypothetical protein